MPKRRDWRRIVWVGSRLKVISRIDEVIAWAKTAVRERFGATGYQLTYTVYGRDGILGELEPLRDRPGHELCIVVQAVAPTNSSDCIRVRLPRVLQLGSFG